MKSFILKNKSFSAPGRAINLDDGTYDQVVIDSCTFTGTAGIFVQAKLGMSVLIQNCTATNIARGPKDEVANFVQISGCASDQSLRSILISLLIQNNTVNNAEGLTDCEDVFSLIMVEGWRRRPLVVRKNTIHGAFPKDLSHDSLWNYTGSGIMIDRGVNWAVVQDNTISETTNVGAAIAGGTNNKLLGNTIRGLHGRSEGSVGLYIANEYKGDPFANNLQQNNDVNWMTAKGRNDVWIE